MGAHAGRGFHRIGARGEVDYQKRRRPLVESAEALVILRAQFDATDVADLQQRSIGLGSDHDIAKLLRLEQTPGGVDRILKVDAGTDGRLPDRAGGILPVLRLDGVVDVGGGQAQLAHLVGIDPDAHAVILWRHEPVVTDAGNAADLVEQVDRGVIIQEQGVVSVVAAEEGDGHQECG